MSQTQWIRVLGISSALACATSEADSVSLPPLALGNASFMDGVAGPGALFELPVQYYRSNSAYDAHGHARPGRQQVHSTTVLPHLAYFSNKTLLGANYGAEVLLQLRSKPAFTTRLRPCQYQHLHVRSAGSRCQSRQP